MFAVGDRLHRICFRTADFEHSADLDYSLLGITEAQAFEMIRVAARRCRDRIGAALVERDIEANPPHIRYIGPLAAKPRTIKLDLADDELADYLGTDCPDFTTVSRTPNQHFGRIKAYVGG